MKIKIFPRFSMLFAMATVILLQGSGCTTSSDGSYPLKLTRLNIDTAMVRYHNRVAFGFLTEGEQKRVADAYKAYQTAFNAAVLQAHSDYSVPTPDNVKQLANQLFSVLDSIP
ncbi:MAG: hypothetical protein H7X97_03710 [Opitutaceae bacterium]|nr:hypothetical protein [Verrucomicrobiales bacterium]